MAAKPGSFLLQLLWVGLGGFVGSCARFSISIWVHRALPASSFPWGTLVVNVAGCLAIGVLGGLMDARPATASPYRLLLIIGVLGGFTTFSTFSYETLLLAQQGGAGRVAANILLQLLLCLGAAWLGLVIARHL